MTRVGLDIESLNRSGAAEFVDRLGGIFEHSPWVPEAVLAQRPFASKTALHQAMCEAVRAAPASRRLELLRAHPELAGKQARRGELTAASTREQAGAGLDACSAAELEKIARLNQAYREAFDFPFIIAVTGLDRFQIIAAMERRLGNNRDVEFDTALGEVEKIARIRIEQTIDD